MCYQPNGHCYFHPQGNPPRQIPDVEQPSITQQCISEPAETNNPLITWRFDTNADQLLNKMDDLSTLIADDEPDLFLITEILPKRNINSLSTARLSLDSYQAFFNFNPDSEQTHTTKCGVGIYVSRKLSGTEVTLNG